MLIVNMKHFSKFEENLSTYDRYDKKTQYYINKYKYFVKISYLNR